MDRSQLRSSAIATGAASLLLLSAAPPAQAASAEACDGPTAAEALDDWGGALNDHVIEGHADPLAPSLDQAEVDHYVPCNGLSAITVPYSNGAAGGTGYRAVMLFHDGEYLGTDALDPQEALVEIERVDAETLRIDYRYFTGEETAMDPAGSAVSMFTWDDVTDSVDHAGEFPPAD